LIRKIYEQLLTWKKRRGGEVTVTSLVEGIVQSRQVLISVKLLRFQTVFYGFFLLFEKKR